MQKLVLFAGVCSLAIVAGCSGKHESPAASEDAAPIPEETSADTDVTETMASETWLLESGQYQIEVMANLDQVPATGAIIVVTWPKVENGFGFPARAFAILP